jgi:hypothetical protein
LSRVVPPTGFEPVTMPYEGTALSIELRRHPQRGIERRKHSIPRLEPTLRLATDRNLKALGAPPGLLWNGKEAGRSHDKPSGLSVVLEVPISHGNDGFASPDKRLRHLSTPPRNYGGKIKNS